MHNINEHVKKGHSGQNSNCYYWNNYWCTKEWNRLSKFSKYYQLSNNFLFFFISNKEAIYFNSKTADKIEYGYANIQNSRTQISIGNPKGVNAGTETRPKNMVVEFIIKIF